MSIQALQQTGHMTEGVSELGAIAHVRRPLSLLFGGRSLLRAGRSL
jgi:hypothetical protein